MFTNLTLFFAVEIKLEGRITWAVGSHRSWPEKYHHSKVDREYMENFLRLEHTRLINWGRYFCRNILFPLHIHIHSHNSSKGYHIVVCAAVCDSIKNLWGQQKHRLTAHKLVFLCHKGSSNRILMIVRFNKRIGRLLLF